MERMMEPTHIKPNEIMFYFEEYLQFKGINKSIDLNKTWKNVKSILAEIQSCYIPISLFISFIISVFNSFLI